MGQAKQRHEKGQRLYQATRGAARVLNPVRPLAAQTFLLVVLVSAPRRGHYDILDYDKMRALFGELLREVQRIKSQGDFAAGQALVETYGVKVDPKVHANVLERSARITVPPYAGFIQPRLVPVMDQAGNISDVKVEYPEDFIQQMLEYGQKFSFLPDQN